MSSSRCNIIADVDQQDDAVVAGDGDPTRWLVSAQLSLNYLS
jgi:hypothetical protein